MTLLNLIKSMSAEVDAACKEIVLLPLGSLEQHGTEAPLGCDGMIAEALCRTVGKRLDVAVLPTLFYGDSHCHTSFPGTFSLSEKTYTQLLKEIISEAARNNFSRILLLSGHGGNRRSAEKAIAETCDPIKAKYLGYWALPGVAEKEISLFGESGYHITTSEVSMVWHLLSGRIPGAFTGTYPQAIQEISTLSPENWKKRYPDGGVGADLSSASVDSGRTLFEYISDSLVGYLTKSISE